MALNKEEFSDLEGCLAAACERGEDEDDELSASGSSGATVEANVSAVSADHSHCVDNDDYNVMLSSSSTPTAPVADGEAFDTFSSFSLSALASQQQQQQAPARHDYALRTSSTEIEGCFESGGENCKLLCVLVASRVG